MTTTPDDAATTASVTVCENGPYEVTGPVRIVAADGTVIREGERFFLCRCGQSRTKPFCDNSHRTSGFTDDGLGPKPKKARE